MKAEGDPVQMNWIIQFYPKNGLDGAHMGTSQTKNSKCIGSNMVNHAQDWSWVKKFIDLPNKHIPRLHQAVSHIYVDNVAITQIDSYKKSIIVIGIFNILMEYIEYGM